MEPFKISFEPKIQEQRGLREPYQKFLNTENPVY